MESLLFKQEAVERRELVGWRYPRGQRLLEVLRQIVERLQRVLNIDGYSIIRRDDSSDSIELDRNSLLRQFGLV